MHSAEAAAARADACIISLLGTLVGQRVSVLAPFPRDSSPSPGTMITAHQWFPIQGAEKQTPVLPLEKKGREFLTLSSSCGLV